METALRGKRAAVAAASQGLGFATAAALIAEGAQVAICGRDGVRVAAAADRLGERAIPITADVGHVEGALAFVEKAQHVLGGIDILVTNTGGPKPGRVADTAIDSYAPAFESMCLGAIAMCNAVVPAMRAQQWGRIVAITSISVRQPIPTLILSNTARAALTAYLKTLSGDVAADGITVNSVQPGLHATDRLRSLYGADIERVIDGIPTHTLGDPNDFGAVIAFLCSGHARFITGAAIPVDGGTNTALQ